MSRYGKHTIPIYEFGRCRNLENGLRRLSDPKNMLLRGVAILHLTLTIKAATSSCPHLCSCSQDTVICTGQGLLRIPSRIPPDTVRLDLQENKISEIRKNDLKALRRLKILQLMDNQIHMIESGAFDNLIALERLRLNRNRLRTLPDKIFINNVNLHRLLVISRVMKPFYVFVE
uniref:Bm11005 n=1 Tax=Brugia malayi TaxID=6279 RepID=A0A1I9G5B8_BRUMA|nr:Bm11005 [Brugia malayi]